MVNKSKQFNEHMSKALYLSNQLNLLKEQLKRFEMKNEPYEPYTEHKELQLIDKHKLNRDHIVKYDFGDVEGFRAVSLCDDKIFKFEFGSYSVNRRKKYVASKFKVYLEDVAELCGEVGVIQFNELVKLFKNIAENCCKNTN